MHMEKISERVIMVIAAHTPEKNRPLLLEDKTGVAAESWRKMLAGKQRATLAMVEEVAKQWPDYAYWLACGDTEPEYGNYAPMTAVQAFTARGEPSEARTKERIYKQKLLEKLDAASIESYEALDEAIFKAREKQESSVPYLWLERLLRSFGESFHPRLALLENDDELIELRRLSMEDAEAMLKSCKVHRGNFWSFRGDSTFKKVVGKFLLRITSKK